MFLFWLPTVQHRRQIGREVHKYFTLVDDSRLGRRYLLGLGSSVYRCNFISRHFVVSKSIDKLLYRINGDFSAVFHHGINTSGNIDGCQEWHSVLESNEFAKYIRGLALRHTRHAPLLDTRRKRKNNFIYVHGTRFTHVQCNVEL